MAETRESIEKDVKMNTINIFKDLKEIIYIRRI